MAVKDTVGRGQGGFGVTEGLVDEQYDDGAAEWCKYRPRASPCHPVLSPYPRPPGRGIVVSHTFSALPQPRMTSLVYWEEDNLVFTVQGREPAAGTEELRGGRWANAGAEVVAPSPGTGSFGKRWAGRDCLEVKAS